MLIGVTGQWNMALNVNYPLLSSRALSHRIEVMAIVFVIEDGSCRKLDVAVASAPGHPFFSRDRSGIRIPTCMHTSSRRKLESRTMEHNEPSWL